jgi:hypothetical protein
VAGITHRGYAVESLARWDKPICPFVAGALADQNEFIRQSVSRGVLAAGAPLAAGKCRPNFHVVLTPEPDQLLDLWRKRVPGLFGGTTPTAVNHVMSKARPVRVWYNVREGCAEGVDFQIGGAEGLGRPMMAGSCVKDSRLTFNAVNIISSVLVLVDFDDIREIKLGQLADYIVMVGLTDVDLDGDWGDAPTVLRLFANPDDANSLHISVWDRAFLKALYRTEQKSRFQRYTIAQEMIRDLADH